MWLQNVNMNFQLKHLMREQVCVHNIVTCECFCWEKHQWGPLGSVPLQCFTVMHCLLNTHQAAGQSYVSSVSLKMWKHHR